MRVSKKEIPDRAVIVGILTKCHVGRLGTIGGDGYPMIKPLNFVHYKGKIFFHSAQEGEKIEDIRRDSRVCFEADLPIAYVKSLSIPCKADYLYRSVIVKGKACIVTDKDERISVLKKLMDKYQPDGGHSEFPEEKLQLTAIIRIDVEEMTGKEDLGKGTERETALSLLKGNVPIPGSFERK
jgi:uncharacterized protein